MKLANAGLSTMVESSGVQTTSAFNIARTPHMFNILSSGLYSDKIGAVLREIGCNAMDAHIMGGFPDRPFQVKLPSSLDRSFYVKDWGPGLDDHELRDLYTTYGWSSKQDNDDVTGAFGLGSKSPFAYTLQNEDDSDGFTVEAAKDGIKRIYTCYIGESGAPAISRLFEGPADEDWPHGVKVTFPVQGRDVAEFHEKARDVFRWFKVKPEILGLNSPLVEPKFRFNRSDFFALAPADDKGSCLIMGNVRYPLNAARLRDLSKTESALLSASMHLWVPLGTVMMTPSREDLEYTDRTRRGVKEWLGKAAAQVASKIREDVTTPEPTKWEWYRKIQSYYETLPFGLQTHLDDFLLAAGMSKEEVEPILQTVREKTASAPKWLGDGLAGARTPYKRDGEGRVVFDEFQQPVLDENAETRGCRAWLYRASTLRECGVVRREIIGGRIHSGGDKWEQVSLSFTSNVKVFHSDAKMADARVKAAVRDSELDTAILLVSCKGTAPEFSKVYGERVTGSPEFEGLSLVPVSTLAIPPEVEEAKRLRKLAREQSPREFFADKEVKYLGLNGKVMDVTLGELDEETDLYYLCATNLGAGRKEKLWNGSAGGTIQFNGGYRQSVMSSVDVLAKQLGLALTGVVVVPTEGAAKRLKLAEQGFKPFLPWLKAKLSDKGNWAELTKHITRVPHVDLKEMWRADDYGWLGILGHHKVTDSMFWRLFSCEPVAATLVKEVDEFVTKVMTKKAGATNDAAPQAALLALARSVSGIYITTDKLSDQSSWEVKGEFAERWQVLQALNEGTVVKWMTESVPRALAVFRTMLSPELAFPAETIAKGTEDPASEETAVEA